jgi:hypothetical protein
MRPPELTQLPREDPQRLKVAGGRMIYRFARDSEQRYERLPRRDQKGKYHKGWGYFQ